MHENTPIRSSFERRMWSKSSEHMFSCDASSGAPSSTGRGEGLLASLYSANSLRSMSSVEPRMQMPSSILSILLEVRYEWAALVYVMPAVVDIEVCSFPRYPGRFENK